MAGTPLTVTMSGGGPWGFRLYGGGDDPLVVARLRKHSKASDAGLCEGDQLMSINGSSCQGMSHGNAMSMLEGSQQLQVTVVRGGGSLGAPQSAFHSVGGSLAAGPPSLQSSSPSYGGPPSPRPFTTSPQPLSASPRPFQNGPAVPPPQVSRVSHTFQDGDTTTNVATETSTQQFGSSSITKVRREVTQQSGYRPMDTSPAGPPGGQQAYQSSAQMPMFTPSKFQPSSGPSSLPTQSSAPMYDPSAQAPIYKNPTPASSQAPVYRNPKPPSQPIQAGPQPQMPMFNVKKFQPSQPQQPSGWAPSSINVAAPPGVGVQQHNDASVTLTFGMGDTQKENIPPSYQKPVPQFNVKKVSTGAPPSTWQPGGAFAPQQQRVPSPRQPEPQPQQQQQPEVPSWGQPSQPPRSPQPFQMRQPSPEPMSVSVGNMEDIPILKSDYTMPQEFEQIPAFDIRKLLQPGEESDESPLGSPGAISRRTKKKKVPTATLR